MFKKRTDPDINTQQTLEPTCAKCGGHRFTFREVYGPQERVREIEELIQAANAQAEGREQELEKWASSQKEALERKHQEQLAELQPDEEDSAFLLLNDDAELRQKLEDIETELEQAQVKLKEQIATLKQKIDDEREATLQAKVGPECVMRLVFCEDCGLVVNAVGSTEKSGSLSCLERAIHAMHRDIVQCLKSLVTRSSSRVSSK